jgi:hypothetical protein
MYQFLRTYLPSRAADWISAIWFATLIILTLYFAFEPNAEFIYLML